jgi:hypothetical protein
MAASKKTSKKSSHIVFKGNRSVVLATREAIGAMKYKGQ